MKKIVCLVLLSGAIALAEENAETNIPTITVTASRNELIYLNKAETVQVIDRKDIETSVPSQTGDMLKYSTGASISTGTGSGLPDRSVVSLNGLPPQYTLILVDGIPLLSDHSFSGANLELIPPECIERIEVLRGAASAQYGRDAIGGVVNIVTRKWTGKPFVSVGASVGSFDTYENNINVMLPLGENAQLSSSVSWEKSDGIPLTKPTNRVGYSGYERFSMFNRLDVRLGDQTTAFASLNGVWNNVQWKSAGDDKDVESTMIAPTVGLTQEIDPSTEFFMQLSFSEWQEDVSNWTHQNTKPEAHLTHLIGESHVLMVGGDWQYTTFERNAVTNTPSQRAYGLFVQDEWTPNDQVTLMGALRYDKVNDIDYAISPKLSALYTPADWIALRASAGQGFHAPTLMELYEDGYGHGGTAYRFGNPDLEPEYSTTYTAGLELKPVDPVQLSVYGFYSEIDDMIVPVYEGAWSGHPGKNVWRRQNIKEATVYGVETSAKWTLNDLLSLEGGYTWTENEDESTGRQLPYSPGSSAFAKVVLTEQFSSNLTVTAFLGARYTWDREAWSWKPEGTPTNPDGLTYELDNYVQLDAGVTVRHGDLAVFAKVENILGEDIENLDDSYTITDGEPFFRIGLQYNLPFLN